MCEKVFKITPNSRYFIMHFSLLNIEAFMLQHKIYEAH